MNDKNKFTPGPWHMTPGFNSWYYVSNKTREVAKTQEKADARLISAAPELIEALEAVIAIADRDTDVFNNAKAAIKKARGE